MRELKSKLFKDRLRSLIRSKTPERNTAEATGAGPPVEAPQPETNNSRDTANAGSHPDAQSQTPHAGENRLSPINDRVPGPVEARNDPPSPVLPEEPTKAGISFRLWNEAYDSIEEKQSELVETYEKILSQQIAEDGALRVTTGNAFTNCTGQERLALMKSAVVKSVERANRHESVRDGIIETSAFIANLNKILGGILEPYPPASMVWSGICTVLPILVSPFVADKAMAEGLSHIISRMDWYMDLSNVLLEDSWESSAVFSKLRVNVEQRIVGLYEALLQYEMQSVAYCFHDHPVVKSMKTILGFNDWESRRKSIDQLEAGLEKDLDQFANQEMVQHLRGLSQSTGDISRGFLQFFEHQQQLQRHEILRERAERRKHQSSITGQFKTTRYEEQMKLNPDRVPETCKWFRQHEKFKQWQTESNGLLLVSADPGCGKSVLARYLVEDVLPSDDPAATVCYFFFKDNPEQASLPNALCALLHRIFYENSSLADHCEGQIKAAGSNLHSDSTSLWAIFETVVSHQDVGQVICVLDALDECDPSGCRSLLRLLKRSMLSSTSSIRQGRIKFLITTRGYPEILDEFQDFESACIHLSGDSTGEKQQIQREINLVLDHRLAKLSAKKRLSPDRRTLIREALRYPESEQRTYLWVSLVFDVLDRNFNDTQAGWEKLIKNPPTTVFRAYEKLLERVDPEDMERVKILFDLIIAAERPLTLSEVNIAIHVRDRIGAYSEAELDLAPNENFRKWLIHTCGFFVTEYADRVFFIHQTAKEFLLQDAAKGEPNVWRNSVTMSQAHRSMAESCIAYLSMKVFTSPAFRKTVAECYKKCDKDIRMRLGSNNYAVFERGIPSKRYRFFNYVLRYWVGHFRSAQEFEGSAVRDIDKKFDASYFSLFDDKPPITMPWLVMAASLEWANYAKLTEMNVETRRCVASVTVASVAALFGHLRLLQQYTEQNGAADYQNREMGQYPDAASDEDEPPDQPIFFAAMAGRIHCLDYILSRSVQQIGARDKLQRTPLHIAARYARLPILRLLIDRGASVNARDQAGRTALDHLIRYNRAENDIVGIIRCLISNGGKYRLQTDSLLHIAASLSHETFPELQILEREHQLDSLEPTHVASEIDLSSDIFKAAYGQSFIKFLIDNGEDLNSRGVLGKTPLHLACINGRVWNAIIFLHNRVDINAPDDLGHTPLHYACNAKNGSTLVAILLKYKASVTAADLRGQTALHWGCGQSNPDIVRLLLEAGAAVNAPELNGATPLMIASANQNLSLSTARLDLLLRHGADVRARDTNGRTALHYAYERHGALIVVRTLLSAGADIEARDGEGRTPLQDACHTHNGGMVRSLEKGVYISVPEDWMPMDIAVERRSEGFVELLEGRVLEE
ncbi:hypothetical protein QBC33DRAFT_211496 [Phialemonium atrogriseum]|uniref:NWD NACHT-NTPase N-terminal domain-containing protein n=1 Tax=Phialemonium atrogriseum TaxID=1093897 RepID=A0AAJ0BT56_9PEZI|nr:uncharacterized protein QBC33DRAFT_211496 [Phialemonium atrogriseum]KAK1764019.1 hypothetical protein QBC33DRAFT_211496 [Phialemonium atrogriseum]